MKEKLEVVWQERCSERIVEQVGADELVARVMKDILEVVRVFPQEGHQIVQGVKVICGHIHERIAEDNENWCKPSAWRRTLECS